MKFALSLALAAATTAVADWTHDPHGHSEWSNGVENSWTGSVDWSNKWSPAHRWGHHRPPPPGNCPVVPTMGNATFTQLIDHNNPSLGTFEQFYFYDTKYWKGPGSPVIFFTPGEINVTGYTTYLDVNRTTGVLAEKIGAATIVMEHRYWGYSSPFADLTSENLQYLTLENSLKDFTRFAQIGDLPFAKHGSNAKDVPWVIMGGSYSGAISAWTESTEPGVFWAYHASSAPVQAVSDYYGYFEPIMEGMAKNCTADLIKIVDHMDDVFLHGSAQEQHDLKVMFGLQDLKHNDDVMGVLLNSVEQWQENQLYTGYSAFFAMCDAVEGVFNQTTPTNPGAAGVGLAKALPGYAAWIKNQYIPGSCAAYGYAEFQGDNNVACFDTYDAQSPLYTDRTLSNQADRQWVWMTCNEPFGYWQGGAPDKRPFVVTRLIQPDYYIRQCGLWFPDGYGIKSGRTEAQVNKVTGGWNDRVTHRLIYANGQVDPWREAGVSSDQRPGGPMKSTAQTPINIVPGGFHTSDLITRNGLVNPGCQAVIDAELNQLAAWVAEFPKTRHWSA